MSPTFHTASMGWPTHSSVSSYVYNHIGMFATAGETLGAVVVPRRRAAPLPDAPVRVPGGWRRVGGVALRVARRATGRSATATRSAHYDPATLDRALLVEPVRAVRERRATAIGSTGSTTGCVRSACPTRTRRRSTSSPLSGVDSAEDIRDRVHDAVPLRLRGRRPDDGARVRHPPQSAAVHGSGRSSPPTSATGTCPTSARCCPRRGSWSRTDTRPRPTSARSPSRTRCRCGRRATRRSSPAPRSRARCANELERIGVPG